MFSITLSPLRGVDVCVYWQLLANNEGLYDIQDNMGHIWVIYRHVAVAMSTLAFWLPRNLTMRMCMPQRAADSCVK